MNTCKQKIIFRGKGNRIFKEKKTLEALSQSAHDEMFPIDIHNNQSHSVKRFYTKQPEWFGHSTIF